jgi:hypothetical protein
MRFEQREGRRMPVFGARRDLPDGSEDRSNEGWHFTDKWGAGIMKGYVLNTFNRIDSIKSI